jgi:hypothetical protein
MDEVEPEMSVGSQALHDTLRAIYVAFQEYGQWPTFLYLSSTLWRTIDVDPRVSYYALSDDGLVQPPISRARGAELRENTRVGLTLRGLTLVTEAADDVIRFVKTIRGIGERAASFRPSSASALETLQVSSASLGDTSQEDATGVGRRQGVLVRDLGWMLWTSFHDQSDDGDWNIAVNVERARLFRDVQTMPDIIDVIEAVRSQDAPAPWAPIGDKLPENVDAGSDSAVQQVEPSATKRSQAVHIARAKPGLTRLRKLSRTARTLLTVTAAIATIVGAWFGYVAVRDATRNNAIQAAKVQSAQARLVSASLTPGQDGIGVSESHGQLVSTIDLFNNSTAPVYHVVVSLVLVQGAGPYDGQQLSRLEGAVDPYQRDLSELPPGHYEVDVSGNWEGMMARAGVEVAFTDAAGLNWLRYANGELRSIAGPAASYYRLQEPRNWITPTKADS